MERSKPACWKSWDAICTRDLLVGRIDSGEAAARFALPDDPDQMRGLDVCYLTPEQVVRALESCAGTPILGVPALCVEVISASEGAVYINQKLADYLAGGAQLVWLVYPRTRTVQVHRADGSGQLLDGTASLDGAAVLPGSSVPLAPTLAPCSRCT